jgi:hypothetical protein
MPAITYDDWKVAKDSLPEGLRNVRTAVSIKILMAFTEKEGQALTVRVAIPPHDLEPLLVSGFIRLEHLEPVKGLPGRYEVVVDDGRLRVQQEPVRC